MLNKEYAILFAAILISSTALAQPLYSNSSIPRFYPVQTHRGEMDTDGILSEGELRNPAIDYDREKRAAERENDRRLDNPYNEDAARDARGSKDWERERQERYEYDRERQYDRDEDRKHNGSFWDW